jgi:microcompartment protein CcmL/EutN
MASQFTEVVKEGVLPKLSDETSKILSKKLQQISQDFKKMKVENYSKLENRI